MGMFHINSGAAAGANGAATASAVSTTRAVGTIAGVYIQYNDSPPATTDVGIKTKGATGLTPSIAFLTVTDANTSGYFIPLNPCHLAAGTVIQDEYRPFTVDDYIQVDIAQANAADNVDVYIYLV